MMYIFWPQPPYTARDENAPYHHGPWLEGGQGWPIFPHYTMPLSHVTPPLAFPTEAPSTPNHDPQQEASATAIVSSPEGYPPPQQTPPMTRFHFLRPPPHTPGEMYSDSEQFTQQSFWNGALHQTNRTKLPLGPYSTPSNRAWGSPE